jgi:hypothetical protein
MATARSRTRTKLHSSGGKVIAHHVFDDYHQPAATSDESMSDWIGNRHGINSLHHEGVDPILGYVNGRVSYYYSTEGYYHYDGMLGPVSPSEPAPSHSDAVLKALANTNPSRPEVDLPVFIMELRDMPRMIKHLGDSIKHLGSWNVRHLNRWRHVPKSYAENILATEFGWKPLLNDLVKMLDFVDEVDTRVNEIKRLKSERGLRRNQTVYSDDGTTPTYSVYVGPPYANKTRFKFKWRTRRRMWVSVNWKPINDISSVSDTESLDLARSLVLGLDIKPATLWEAMPWSWLIDWFSSTGDWLDSHRNRIPVTANDICVMESSRTYAKYMGIDSNPYGATFTPNSKNGRFVHKRTPIHSHPLPSFHLPFLDGRQWSILSSLAVLNIGR